ncbi:uncharacterized protein LOC131680950 [Topomyia yanbarensis]|uniref:uncharacterized protein LOC131680950 n=1 Tax=Topomyia yanbarensis TaxID=2498891 RepID=UPI00273C6DBF|nr:uncharacterized protein LOC131680950 [Topomyia yanbarensis]
MEIQTLTLEQWMCRICLGKGSYKIFEDQLSITTNLSPSNDNQGHPEGFRLAVNDAITIVDALNCFSEFKISPSEIDNEPIMLCERCCSELLRCYNFRIKVHDAESLVRRNCAIRSFVTEEEEGKTGLTLQLANVDPSLEDDDESSDASADLTSEPDSLADLVKPGKVHYAKPRFQLTNQVSSILRHVTASSISFEGKRKESEEPICSSTPTKVQRKDNEDRQLEKTLVVPNFIFTSEMKDSEKKNVLHVEKTTISPSSRIFSEKDVDRVESHGIFYCTHCPKTFSRPHHLSVHIRSAHLCQHCLKHFPNVFVRNEHIMEDHKTFRCSMCSFQSQCSDKLGAHLKESHAVNLSAHGSILPVEAGSSENK